MTDVLVVAEVADGRVRKATLCAITCAREAIAEDGGSFSILLLGHNVAPLASELTAYGAAKVMVCDDPSLENYLAEQYAPTVAAAAAGSDLVVATATSFGKDLMPRVAARLGAAYAGDCAGVAREAGKLVFKRPMFAGNAYGYCELTTAIATATARQSEFEAATPSGGGSPVETVAKAATGAAAERVEYISLDQVKSERPELTEATVVVSGGRGVKDRFFEVMGPLADALGAAIGASRAECDAGFAPGDYQVGQTGKIVAPQLYMAVGISGAIQHVAGMKSSRVIVAINKDPEAPIFQLADYGLEADLFKAVPELTQAILAHKAGAG